MYFYGDEFSDELSKTMNIITAKNKDTYKSMGRSFTWVNTCFFKSLCKVQENATFTIFTQTSV